jgi:hypothetical protein
MPKINELLKNRDKEFLDHDQVFEGYPWIFEENKNCIISPDSDGFMCGLLMSHFFNWNIKGFYDGKVMLYSQDVTPKDCIFLDIEIFSKKVRSVGQHCIIPSQDKYRELNLDGFDSCLSPGMLRGYDGRQNFQLKFPFGTIHFLISLLSKKREININREGITSLLFVDGMFNVLFKYPENSLNWFNYLSFSDKKNPLNQFFYEHNFGLSEIMKLMDEYFKKRDSFGGEGRSDRGDHLIISDKNSKICNTYERDELHFIEEDWVKRMSGFIKMNADNIGWSFDPQKWTWGNFKAEIFEKRILGGDNSFTLDNGGKTLALKNLASYYEQGIVSNAQTSGGAIEYSVYKNNHYIFN